MMMSSVSISSRSFLVTRFFLALLIIETASSITNHQNGGYHRQLYTEDHQDAQETPDGDYLTALNDPLDLYHEIDYEQDEEEEEEEEPPLGEFQALSSGEQDDLTDEEDHALESQNKKPIRGFLATPPRRSFPTTENYRHTRMKQKSAAAPPPDVESSGAFFSYQQQRQQLRSPPSNKNLFSSLSLPVMPSRASASGQLTPAENKAILAFSYTENGRTYATAVTVPRRSFKAHKPPHNHNHNHQQQMLTNIPPSTLGTPDLVMFAAVKEPAVLPGALYNHRVTSLICGGVPWQVQQTNVYACCGQAVYRINSERCLPGNRIERQPPPPQPLPAPPPPQADQPQSSIKQMNESSNVGTLTALSQRPRMQMIVCQTQRYSVPAQDADFYACCGDRAYFWPSETCQDGNQLRDNREALLPTRTPQLADVAVKPPTAQLDCQGIQHQIDGQSRPFYGCCGKRLIDRRVETCSDYDNDDNDKGGDGDDDESSDVNQNQNDNSNDNNKEVDNDDAEDSNDVRPCPAGFICCGRFAPVSDVNGLLRCCGDLGPYDPSVSVCN